MHELSIQSLVKLKVLRAASLVAYQNSAILLDQKAMITGLQELYQLIEPLKSGSSYVDWTTNKLYIEAYANTSISVILEEVIHWIHINHDNNFRSSLKNPHKYLNSIHAIKAINTALEFLGRLGVLTILEGKPDFEEEYQRLLKLKYQISNFSDLNHRRNLEPHFIGYHLALEYHQSQLESVIDFRLLMQKNVMEIIEVIYHFDKTYSKLLPRPEMLTEALAKNIEI